MGVGIPAVILVVILAAIIIPMVSRSSTPATSAADTSSGSQVIYEVLGTARTAEVTSSTNSGTEQHTVAIPMQNQGGTEGVTFTADSGQSLYISAQNQQESGSVECIITVDGDVVSDNTSDGAYAIAQCSASAP